MLVELFYTKNVIVYDLTFNYAKEYISTNHSVSIVGLGGKLFKLCYSMDVCKNKKWGKKRGEFIHISYKLMHETCF